MPGRYLELKPVRSTLWAEVSRLAFVIGLEQRILALIVSYALAIALFSLVVPLTVQELVNSFAFSIQPVMIVTLALIILIGLLFIGFFRVFQTSATEILFQTALYPYCNRHDGTPASGAGRGVCAQLRELLR